MEFSTKAIDWTQAGMMALVAAKSECLVLGLFEGQKKLAGLAGAFDAATDGHLGRLLKLGDFDGKRGSHLLLTHVQGAGAARVLLVGLGKEAELTDLNYLESVRTGFRALSGTKAGQATWTLTESLPKGRDLEWALLSTVQATRELQYSFALRHPQLKTRERKPAPHLSKLLVAVDRKQERSAKLALAQGMALGNGMDLTRDLANLPANICTPTYLAQQARALGKEYKLGVEVLGRKQLEALKMGSFLAVTQGAEQSPQFIVIKYNGAGARQAPVVLVGKGVTFDTGGISLKPGEGMDEMKFDMCGAASVLGTLRAIAEMGLKQNVVGIIPACENMPSGCAIKPGDVVTSMSGQTIEILNTDAEGRLILCDALTYAERFKPAAVIDIATLTGACVIALGHVNTGLFSKHDALADALLQAGRESLDTAWRMPLDDAYQEQLKSNFADIANIGGRPAGSVTAACFLARFTSKYDWAHLDIAGTAWKSGAQKGATARPVPLLVRYLMSRGA